MIDYWAYTNDTSYNAVTAQALLAQTGPNNDYMPVEYHSSMGNDDQSFWALSVMSAAEYGFPENTGRDTTWLDIAQNVFDAQIARWGTDTCGGGLRWQVFEANAGWDYKNSISNGGLFQLAARLARHTGNQIYVDWAGRVYDWSAAIGLVDARNYALYDGSDAAINCTELDHTQWTYNLAMYMYGAAAMYNYTNGSSIWQERLDGFVARSAVFFSPFENATNIMFERQCELGQTCNLDQCSFKAYLGRWMAKTAVLAPHAADAIFTLLRESAVAAARSCSGLERDACGSKWYVDGFDGRTGIGQQLSALEVVQASLARNGPVPAVQPQVTIATPSQTTTLPVPGATGSRDGVVARADERSSAIRRRRRGIAW